ncbi:hypothetical protein IWX90DRAFT_16693 [Phyllosticta citrichinensis]|uniref:Uncharacterized protein n=1 Tax=Phyllosticta citrichinensis TaxID=1130410 RepID=A0ABR1Y624_9PEZI
MTASYWSFWLALEHAYSVRLVSAASDGGHSDQAPAMVPQHQGPQSKSAARLSSTPQDPSKPRPKPQPQRCSQINTREGPMQSPTLGQTDTTATILTVNLFQALSEAKGRDFCKDTEREAQGKQAGTEEMGAGHQRKTTRGRNPKTKGRGKKVRQVQAQSGSRSTTRRTSGDQTRSRPRAERCRVHPSCFGRVLVGLKQRLPGERAGQGWPSRSVLVVQHVLLV